MSRLFIAAALLFALAAPAVAIEFENGINVVRGFVVKDDGKKLSVRIEGKAAPDDYDKAKIKIIFQPDYARLEKLSPENPKAYRDYADELARRQSDPESQYFALRLYLIAAHLDPEKLGRSSLLGMSAIAKSPGKARKYRAMAYLLDPKTDAALLKKDGPPPFGKGKDAKDADNALRSFQQALRLFRTGHLKDARQFATQPGVDKFFDAAPGMLEPKAFLQVCDQAECSTCKTTKHVRCPDCEGKKTAFNFGNEKCFTCAGSGQILCRSCDGTGASPSVIENHLPIILRTELWAAELFTGEPSDLPVPGGWGATYQSRQMNPVPVLSLETITEFDPRQCLFRDYAWKTPAP